MELTSRKGEWTKANDVDHWIGIPTIRHRSPLPACSSLPPQMVTQRWRDGNNASGGARSSTSSDEWVWFRGGPADPAAIFPAAIAHLSVLFRRPSLHMRERERGIGAVSGKTSGRPIATLHLWNNDPRTFFF
jgi:hypothetical protein